MARNDWEEQLAALLGGVAQGYSSQQTSAGNLRNELLKEKLKFMFNPPKYEPRTREEAIDFERAKLDQREYKPRTREEAIEFERAKAGIIRPSQEVANRKNELQVQELENKIAEGSSQRELKAQDILDTAQSNLDTVRRVKAGKEYFGPLANMPTVATPGGLLRTVTGFNKEGYAKRKEWENNINKLLSQKVVDLISTMKAVSKTGATGFGQLSEREGQLLREASTALSKDLDPDTAMYYLNEMENLYSKIIAGKNKSPLRMNNNTTNTAPDIRTQYNMLREQGLSSEQAKARLGI